MKPLPHRYQTRASAQATGSVSLQSGSLRSIESAAPIEFGGPGDRWSPEALFLSSIADCYVLTFRAIARSARLPWRAIDVEAEGIVANVDGATRFTQVTLHVALTVEDESVSHERAHHLREKAEASCLVSRSLALPVKIDARIEEGSSESARASL